jgi:hypothetical protein
VIKASPTAPWNNQLVGAESSIALPSGLHVELFVTWWRWGELALRNPEDNSRFRRKYSPSWTVDLYASRSRTITAIDEPGSLHAVHAYRNPYGMNGWTALAAEPDER